MAAAARDGERRAAADEQSHTYRDDGYEPPPRIGRNHDSHLFWRRCVAAAMIDQPDSVGRPHQQRGRCPPRVHLDTKMGDLIGAEGGDMVDHAGFAVSNYDRSKGFYEKALAPLEMTLILEPVGAAAGFGKSGKPSFWIEARGTPVHGRLHIALGADTREQVDAFMRPRCRREEPTTVCQDCARSTTPTATGRTCSIPTATTLKASVIDPPSS